MTSTAVLVAENLVRRYGERTVIDHVSVTVAPGESVSLMGTSGAFYVNAASFLVVVMALILMRASSAAPEKSRQFLRETTEGFSYIVSQPVILGVMIMEAVSSVFGLDNAMLTIAEEARMSISDPAGRDLAPADPRPPVSREEASGGRSERQPRRGYRQAWWPDCRPPRLRHELPA